MRSRLQVLAERPLLPVDVLGDRQYLISIRHGELTDRRQLMNLLDGTWAKRAVAQLAEAQTACAERETPGITTLGAKAGKW